MALAVESVAAVAERAKRASRVLARADAETRNNVLESVARLLGERSEEILAANRADLADDRASGLNSSLRDRLALSGERVEAMAAGVRAIAALEDPVGEEIESRVLPSGLRLRKLRVPLGLVAVVYEARPNVTIDCAALTIKSGNAIILRGSSYAAHSNFALAAVVAEALAEAGVPAEAVALLEGGREDLTELATLDGLVDLIIPRGGEGLKQALKRVATVPVMYAASGNCHVYVDSAADLEMAKRIILNAKLSRPGVCNAAESLLVHASVAEDFLPGTLAELGAAGVELVGDEAVASAAAGIAVGRASESDWASEFLDLKLAVGVVDSLEDAIEHVNRYGSGHSEAIVTGSDRAALEFTEGADAAAVYVNASTRFTDGFEYGLGAEVGNSTQKLHARGPIGLRELMTTKYVLRGEGQVRE
ncbi:MAG: glutamate-5-semialdehyde dehydrogenase [Solirubrobacterales bacterium]|nr:glutamate-5-semialdehyde dehydrogenase [Solirubrobacterales bacterium]